jgi:CelD/BcsL family acetyltransferase involved in cellulose biosynthesis
MRKSNAPFDVEIVSLSDMSEADVARWNAWAAPGGELVSPYFRIEFAQAVAKARRDARCAVIRREGEVIGYFPHHAPRGGVIRPIGAPMSDYQGVVARPGVDIPPALILRACRGSALVYDNWSATLGGRPIPRRGREGSVIMDLAEGGEAYLDERRGLFRDHFKKCDRRRRSAEAEHGAAHIEIGDADGEAFDTLMAWKQTQYEQTGKFNVLGVDWVRCVLDDLRKRESGLRGMTSSLWFGGKIAAVEFGLVADGVYHSWFPAYHCAYAKYSPGLLLLHGIVGQADRAGLRRIDLGRGGQHYKKYYASYEAPLDHGRALAPGWASTAIQSWEAAEAAASVLPGKLAELPARARRRWSQVSAFEPRLGPRLAAMAGAIAG